SCRDDRRGGPCRVAGRRRSRACRDRARRRKRRPHARDCPRPHSRRAAPGTTCSARDRPLPQTQPSLALPPIHWRIIAEAEFSHGLGHEPTCKNRSAYKLFLKIFPSFMMTTKFFAGSSISLILAIGSPS